MCLAIKEMEIEAFGLALWDAVDWLYLNLLEGSLVWVPGKGAVLSALQCLWLLLE
jgi:hypothetical protein